MSGTGRGRGGEADPERQNTSSSSENESGSQERSTSSSSNVDQVIRGRGAYRPNLVTQPPNVQVIQNESLPPNCQSVALMSNFLGLKPMESQTIHSYRFDFEPQVESLKLRSALVYRNTETQYFNGKLIFDGMSDGRSTVLLVDQPTVVSVTTNEGDPIKITIKKVGVVSWGAYEMLRLYNMDMKRFLKELGFFQMARGTHVHPSLSTRVQNHSLSIIRGYNTSTNMHDKKNILMNMEPVHKLMQDATVLQIMNRIKGNSLDRGSNIQEAVRTELIGKLCVTTFNKRCYKIEDIDFSQTILSTFPVKDKDPVTYKDYFHTRYGLQLTDKQCPLLVVKQSSNKRRVEGEEEQKTLLPPEICRLAGLIASQANDFKLKNDLVKTCQLNPNEHYTMMCQFIDNFHRNNNVKRILEKWGYNYETEPKRLNGIILPTESIGWKVDENPKNWPKIDRATADFESHLRREKLCVPPKVKQILILIVGSIRSSKDRLLDTLMQGFNKVGLQLPSAPIVHCLDNDRPATIATTLKGAPAADLIIVIIEKQNKGTYDAIKKACTVDVGIPTQVVTARLLLDERKSRGASTKIAVQIAAKIGGEPWLVNLPLQDCMICGYDTYHDTTSRGRSFGAFIASTNKRYSKWYSRVRPHDRLEELSTNLAEDLSESVKNWASINGSLPQRVFLFRDGVGDSQIEHVFKVELKQAKKALKAISKDQTNPIKFTVIIVNKRVGARFYVQNNTQACTNPIPGTVVDSVITREGRYDFYLVSQSTRQGTITPTYYNVIYDESGLRPDKIQMIAFKMCLNYFNWTGGVRVPAPCQYAHKLAFQTGENIHAVPHVSLANSLHFL